jgi:hypothetical protein
MRYSILKYGRLMLSDVQNLEEARKEALRFAKDLVTDYTINQKRQIFNESQNGYNSVTIEPTSKSDIVNL